METEITTLIELLATLLTITFVIAPTVLSYLIYSTIIKRGNPKIQMLEEANAEIVEGTNEALNEIVSRLEAIEVAVEDIANNRPSEIKGFKNDK
jgi:UDP-N-acetylmuramate-alanine ligase